jgi:ABC-type polysaccharide/polyol phosphate transport system ATPase subunit
MPAALRVEAISKQYRIYDRPADRLKESLTRGRWKAHREFWALKDISFEIEAGTTTGIIGPNGSGKSTLLQIITGTLEPTHGSVWLEGRVAALLELGAGFNPEFTGIENIFMNAALMGLSKSDTESLLPEIANFAEIGDFIYQPMKTYSSGMYIRLAFAAAVAVSPNILIIDEALAVGDAVFQHRCTRRIKQMQENGTTILFVSHDPGAIRALCTRAILLNTGRMEAEGAPAVVLNRYQKIIMARETAYAESSAADQSGDESPHSREAPSFSGADSMGAPSYTFRHGNGDAEIIKVELLDTSRRKVQLVETGEQLFLRMYVVFHKAVEEPVFGFLIRNRHGIHLYGTNTDIQNAGIGPVEAGDVVEANFSFDGWLAPDHYSIAVATHSLDAISFDWLDGALFFQTVSASPMEGVANLDASAATRKVVHDYNSVNPVKIDS